MDDLSPSSTLGHVYAQLTNLQKLRRNANESLLSLLYASLLSKQPSEPLLNGRQDTGSLCSL